MLGKSTKESIERANKNICFAYLLAVVITVATTALLAYLMTLMILYFVQ
jgi:hypothetical protein